MLVDFTQMSSSVSARGFVYRAHLQESCVSLTAVAKEPELLEALHFPFEVLALLNKTSSTMLGMSPLTLNRSVQML